MKAQRYDAAEFLETREDCMACLNAALEDGDPSLVPAAMGDVVRTCGMAELAQETGMGHEEGDEALSSEEDPSFASVLKAVGALGCRFKVEPLADRA